MAYQEKLEMWAGIEGTMNRVGNFYLDQTEKNGHSLRFDDFKRFAQLGIKTIRYPALWEKVAPTDPYRFHWSELDSKLGHLREAKLEPIIGLLHHGSGPAYTNLTDPFFHDKFAVYALKFAKRYPWVKFYTPINEPLTTARFSGLYGFWYPHAHDDLTFLRILFNELKATVLAMRALRSVNPSAQLIQTEDLGKTTSTKLLSYQADFENHRRWLTFDLLCGKVNRGHPLWEYILRMGIEQQTLEWFLENTCAPDVMGINHYLLSNRFLDHRLELYPSVFHGTNGHHRYADVGACDSAMAHPPTPYDLLKEVWERYDRPFAVTEVHLNGNRENQMRWLSEIWETGLRLKEEGAPLMAITAWSLLGSFDWNSLCTRFDGYYEPGIFDVRAPKPRPTGLAKMIGAMAKGLSFKHPLLKQRGWWHDPMQRPYGFPSASNTNRSPQKPFFHNARPLLITGATGTLGRAFARVCEKRNLPYRLVGRTEMDITQPESVRDLLRQIKPWALVNAAGYVKVDLAEKEPEKCFRENSLGAETLAQACAHHDIPFVTFSSDLVFNGEITSRYLESHDVSPLNVYGRSKAEGERKVLHCYERALVVRSSSFFGPWDEHNFIITTLRRLKGCQQVVVAQNTTISPTYVPDLVNGTLDLLIDGEKGIWHITNDGEITWLNFAKMAADMAKMDGSLIIGGPSDQCGITAPRPLYSALGSERATLLPSVEKSLDTFFSELAIPL